MIIVDMDTNYSIPIPTISSDLMGHTALDLHSRMDMLPIPLWLPYTYVPWPPRSNCHCASTVLVPRGVRNDSGEPPSIAVSRLIL